MLKFFYSWTSSRGHSGTYHVIVHRPEDAKKLIDNWNRMGSLTKTITWSYWLTKDEPQEITPPSEQKMQSEIGISYYREEQG